MEQNTLMRLPEVMNYVHLSRATIYKLVKANQFPQPRKLTTRAIAWRKEDLDKWIEDLPSADLSNGDAC